MKKGKNNKRSDEIFVPIVLSPLTRNHIWHFY